MDGILAKDVTVRELEGGVLTALSGTERPSYDGKADMYDRIIGLPLYNRVMWQTPMHVHTDFAAEAVASGSGPYLEGGCGSALFTHTVYRDADRPLVLLDFSTGMLGAARARVGAGPTWIQGDLFALPFCDAAFETVCSFGVMHVLAEIRQPLSELWRCVAPGGSLWVASIVRPPHLVGRLGYGLLRLLGEVAPARTGEGLRDLLADITGQPVELRVIGSFAHLVVRRPA